MLIVKLTIVKLDLRNTYKIILPNILRAKPTFG